MTNPNVTERTATQPQATDIGQLVAQLGDTNRSQRIVARQQLVIRGRAAAPAVAAALHSSNSWARWEAAKALSEIRDPDAAPALVAALDDEDSSVRWLAAEALSVLGRNALEPLLSALISGHASAWTREGAHHVLHDTAKGDLRELLAPILAALESVVPGVDAMTAAYEALGALRGGQP